MRHALRFTCLLLFSAGAHAQAPTATILPSTNLFCTGVPVTFSAVSEDTMLSYEWSVTPQRGAAFSTATNEKIQRVVFSDPLTYTLNLKVTKDASVFNTSVTFSVSRSAQAAFNASLDATGYPTRLVLTNYSRYSLGYSWQFSDQAEPDTSMNTIKLYNLPGSYTVTLFAAGRNDCNHAETYAFEIPASSSLNLPNVFSPNNDDVNEIYRPMATGIYQLKAWVYNRDGVVLSSWDRVNGFWDGRTTSGQDCPDGVYFIAVEAYGFDGQAYRKQTAITLVR
jgi:gliding motility-associated-like protein